MIAPRSSSLSALNRVQIPGFVSPWKAALSSSKQALDDDNLLVDDDGNAYDARTVIGGPSAVAANLTAKRDREYEQRKFDDARATGKMPPMGNYAPHFGAVAEGYRALKDNATLAQGRSVGAARLPLLSQPRGAGGATPEPWTQGGGGEDVQAANETGYASGADYAIEKALKANKLLALKNAADREERAGFDVDGRSADMVARGQDIQNRTNEIEQVQPRLQVGRNQLGALAGAAARDERALDFAARRPERDYADRQFQTRYVEPARIRAGAQQGVADTNADARLGVADITTGGRTEAARLAALGKAVQEFTKQGQAPDARGYGETGGVLPPSTIGQQLQRLQSTQPGLDIEHYIYQLGPITDEEEAEARRLLGGGA